MMQKISAAYDRLTKEETSEDDESYYDNADFAFDLFEQLFGGGFFGRRRGGAPGGDSRLSRGGAGGGAAGGPFAAFMGALPLLRAGIGPMRLRLPCVDIFMLIFVVLHI